MTLTHEQARVFYDRFGAKQDWQRFYEDRAISDMIAHAAFETARFVLEFGCGTGRLAKILLDHHLPDEARYLGIDVSSTMVSLARTLLAPFGERAQVRLSGGEPRLDADSGVIDRFVATYVLDLLSDDDIRTLIREAHRVLSPGGRLCLVNLTHGSTFASRLLEKAWQTIYAIRPSLVGGCRPISSREFIGPEWEFVHYAEIRQLGLASQVVVATRPG